MTSSITVLKAAIMRYIGKISMHHKIVIINLKKRKDGNHRHVCMDLHEKQKGKERIPWVAKLH